MSKTKKESNVTKMFKCPKCGKRVEYLVKRRAVMRGTIEHCEECDKKYLSGK